MITRLGTDRLIRVSVILTIVGLLLLLPVLFVISGASVGFFMLGSLLIVVAMGLYLYGVVRDLRRREAL